MAKLFAFWLASLSELVAVGFDKASIRGMAVVVANSESEAKHYLALDFKGLPPVVIVDAYEIPGAIVDPEVNPVGGSIVSYLGPSAWDLYPPYPCSHNTHYN